MSGDLPGAAFILARREERNQPQQFVGGADQPHQAALRKAVTRQELRRIGVAHLCQLCFHFAADRSGCGVRPRGNFRQLIFAHSFFQFFPQFARLADIEHVEDWLLAQKHKAAQALLILGRHLHFAERLFHSQMSIGPLEQLKFFFELRRLHLLQIFFQALQAFLDLSKIADHQVELDVLDIAQRIDRADMRNGRIVEGADHMGKRVHLAKVRRIGRILERLLSNGPDIDVLDRSVRQLFRIVERGQPIKPVVRNLGDANVSLARVRVCLLREMGLGQNTKQRCLAYLRQADNSGLHKGSFWLLAPGF